MTETGIRFEDPAPPVPRRPETLSAFAAALRARPGTWALLGQAGGTPGASRQYAYSIRRGSGDGPGRAFGPGFEAEHRKLLGEHRIYVRYTGGGGGA